MIGCKVVDNLVEHIKKFKESDKSPLVDKSKYQQLVGKLIYLLHTHSNFAYQVSVVS
jgi:hypothetical protein